MVDVSIIIPTYGVPMFLEKAILSVQKQNVQKWELLVVDDNDPDTEARRKTEELLEKFKNDTRIHYLKHPYNLNGAVARNTGIKRAKGRYIAFLDSDDEYIPSRLEKCLEVMDAAEANVAAVYTGCEFRRSGHVFNVVTDVKAGNYLIETLACTFLFCTGSNLFVRREVVDELNGFDAAFLRHQDYEFLVRLFEKYDIEAVKEVLVIKNNENVNVPNVQKMIQIKNQYLTKYQRIINSLNSKEINYIYHAQYIQVAEAGMRSKDYRIAKEYYDKAASYCKLTGRDWTRRIAFIIKNILEK